MTMLLCKYVLCQRGIFHAPAMTMLLCKYVLCQRAFFMLRKKNHANSVQFVLTILSPHGPHLVSKLFKRSDFGQPRVR